MIDLNQYQPWKLVLIAAGIGAAWMLAMIALVFALLR